MTREQAIQLLPCLVSCDLPDEVADELRAMVEGDAELQRLHDELATEREDSVRILCDRAVPPHVRELWLEAPAPDELTTEGAPAVRAAPNWLPIAGVAAAALILAGLGLATLQGWLGTEPSDVAVESGSAGVETLVEAYEHVMAHPGDVIAIAAPDRDARLDAAGVPEAVRAYPGLEHLDLSTRGVVILPGEPPGLAMVYEADSGLVYVCQMWTHAPDLGAPAVVERVDQIEVRGFQNGDVSLAVWRMGPMICVFSATQPLPDLLAFVRIRLTSAAG